MQWQRRSEETARVGRAVSRFIVGCAIATLAILFVVAANVATGDELKPPMILGVTRDTGNPCTGIVTVPASVVHETKDEIEACVAANEDDQLGCLQAGPRLRTALARQAIQCPGAAVSAQVERELLRLLTEGIEP